MVTRILRALGSAVRRDFGTLGSFRVNNFFLFVALLIAGALESGLPPVSAYPFLLLLGLLLLLPMSSDPLAKIPAVRLALWPLTTGQRFLLRMASLLLSPVMWLVLGLMLIAAPRLALVLLALAAGTQAATMAARRPLPMFRLPGWMGGLAKNSVRQMASILDFWLAILVSVGATAYRFLYAHPDPAAFPIFAMMAALALSTWSQTLFGLDSLPGITRYRLMPLSGMRILWWKDLVFLGILAVLVLPLDLRVGMTFGLTALAIGHVPSVVLHLPQLRWRFTGGRVLFGVVQAVVSAALANSGLLPLAVAGWLVSLYWCGRWWERHPVN